MEREGCAGDDPPHFTHLQGLARTGPKVRLNMSRLFFAHVHGCSNRKPLELGDVYLCSSYLSDNSLNMSEHSDDMWSVGSHLRCDVIPD